jgi:hypothetical protein
VSDVKGNSGNVHGDVDRVAMLSLKADGTPDQTPGVEIIGNREFAEAATREQFRQQAASSAHAAADQPAGGDLPPQDVEDPEIKARQERNEEAIKGADAAADATVADLFVEPTPVSSPTGTEQASAKPAPAGKSSSSSTSK